MRKILDISTSFKSPSRFVLICSFFFIAHMKSLISTFNCSLLQQTFLIHYLTSIKIFNTVCRSSNFSAGFNLSHDLHFKRQSFKCHSVYPVAAPIFANETADRQQEWIYSGCYRSFCGHKSGAARAWLSATDDELAARKQKMKTSARPVSDWLSILKDLTEGAPRGRGKKRNLAVQSIPHHSSLFTSPCQHLDHYQTSAALHREGRRFSRQLKAKTHFLHRCRRFLSHPHTLS